MQRILFFLLIIIISAPAAQVRKSPLMGNISVSVEGGLTIAKTDYKTSVPGTGNRLMLEYFFNKTYKHIFGFRFFGGGQNILGEDIRKEYSSFKTGMYFTGIGFTYVYELNNRILPYASASVSHLWITTEQESPEINTLEKNNNTFGVSLEAGTRLRIVNNLYFNFSAAVHFLNDDMVDNTALGINNDFYMKTMAGLSFTFVTRKDSDDDGIEDEYDACIKAAEDPDGFEDDDGCPDPDNDNDGIPDASDKCPNLPEDIDGFEDSDGCPDLDNDADGIPDSDDECDNIKEDFDGYEDDDGCPELDNDGDGILDANDRCPELAEDFDGYEDSDGCPDLDNDGDGIFDEKDKCPDQSETFNNYEDLDGCPDIIPQKIEPDQYIEPERSQNQSNGDQRLPLPTKKTPDIRSEKTESMSKTESQTFLLHGVSTFEEESSQLLPQAYAELDRIAAAIKSNRNGKWRIEGYTDNSLSEKESNDFSRKRAQSILKYLVSKGVSQSQLEAVGMGAKNPIESNDKTFGRMRNRRIEIKAVR